MTVELGHFALIVALCLMLAQAFLGLVGATTQRTQWLAAVRPAVNGQCAFVALAFASLVVAFQHNDFSVLYVASNSNSELPRFYRFAAVWAAHEGSLLLWLLVLSIWSLLVAYFSRAMPLEFVARVLGVLGLLSAGFALFILATSNPFARLLPAAFEGRDLNPLLQDPALALHPPILYTGYVGMAVPFAFAMAALLEGKLDAGWARWVRPWTTFAWMFLTVGIALGSWWAYYELGWGGWWFWDPVENASFMPWLVGTALIHSLAVTEKRGLFKSWTVLLAIFAFSLSLLGTFLVRSGVLVSVHSFASDPARGLFILVFLAVCIGGALSLFAWRAPHLRSEAGFTVLSRESFLLLNNMLLLVAASLILLGTLYPLFIDALNLGKISVGPPYFSVVFIIPMLPLVFLMGVGIHAGWKQARLADMQRTLWLCLLGAVVAALLMGVVYARTAMLTVVGLTAGLWVMVSSLIEPITRLRHRHTLSPALLGMSLAHLGLGLFVVGVTTVQSYKIEKDLKLLPTESVELAGYEMQFVGTKNITGPNYDAIEAEVVVKRAGKTLTTLHPQKRIYRVQTSPMTEAGIDGAWQRDLFVAMGDELGQGAWSFRVQYKPLIRFIWWGALVMALGGLVAITDSRYRSKKITQAATHSAVVSE